MNYLGKGSGIVVKPTQWATQYIQAIDVCSAIRYDTMTVWAAPLGLLPSPEEVILSLSKEGLGVRLFPNPTSKGFNIKSNCRENCTVSVIVRNLSGETIIKKTCDLLQGNCFINTAIAAGTYFVTITNESTKESVVRKLLIGRD